VKRVIVFVPVLLASLLLPTALHAGAQETGAVSFANAVTYDFGNNFELTVCLDGVAQVEDLATGATYGPVDVAVGDYDVAFVQGSDCSDSEPFVSGSLTVAPDANLTVMAWWGSEDRDISVFDNDTSCVPAGQSRVTVRNGSTQAPVDLVVTPEGGTATVAVSGVGEGDEATATLAAGAYSSVGVFYASDPLEGLGAQTFEDGSSYVIYVYGGADGSAGASAGPVVANPCETPSSSSSTTSTAAVQNQSTKPTFTG
jgi:hypothetical protein